MGLKIIQVAHILTHIKNKDCSYAYKVVCYYDDQYSKPLQLYRGKNAVYKFLEKMLEEKWCQETLKKHFNKTLELTAAEEKKFKQADKCHICGIRYKSCNVIETIVTSLLNTEVLCI